MRNHAVCSLRWLTVSQQATLASLLTDACQSMTQAWRSTSAASAFSVVTAQGDTGASEPGSTFNIVSDAGHLMAVRLRRDWPRQLLALPSSHTSSLDASSDLLASLELEFVELLARSITPPILSPGLKVQRGSRLNSDATIKGSIHTLDWISDRQVSCGSFTLGSVLVDQLVPRMKHKSASVPASRASAIRGEQMLIKAHVGQVDVSFSALRHLVPGDVLVLGSSLSDPISLFNETGQLVGTGSLGQRDQQRVVRLSSVTADAQIGRIKSVKRSIQ